MLFLNHYAAWQKDKIKDKDNSNNNNNTTNNSNKNNNNNNSNNNTWTGYLSMELFFVMKNQDIRVSTAAIGADTVDGSEIRWSPVEVGSFYLVIKGDLQGFLYTSQVVQDFWHQLYFPLGTTDSDMFIIVQKHV